MDMPWSPTVSSVESSSALAKASTELVAGEGTGAAEVAAVFYFLDTTLGQTWPFLFLDSATVVTFLAAAFFFFISMEANTSGRTTYSS
jgi:glutathione S-transferase